MKKAAPTLLHVLCLLVMTTLQPIPTHAQPIQQTQAQEQTCIQHLQAIGRALAAYSHDKGHLPEELSDLFPLYIKAKSLLHCPADSTAGSVDNDYGHVDAHWPLSYSYERSIETSNGLPRPLGKFPASDLPNASWGSWRLVNGHQMTFFGDQVPTVRCFHHRPSEAQRDAGIADNILNLTTSGKVYHNGFLWEEAPETVEVMLQTFDHDVRALSAKQLLERWLLWRVREYCVATEEAAKSPTCQIAMRSLAPRLAEIAASLPDEQRITCNLAAGFFEQTHQYARMLPVLDQAAKYPGAEWSDIVEDQMRARANHALKQTDKEIAVYQSLLQRRPDVHPYMLSLADAYETAGQRDKAQEWRDKADPGKLLIGKPAPDFTISLLDGSTFHLKDALQGKKAVLVNFWFCSCEPCRREFPHIQEWYTQLQAKGLALVCINHGDTTDNVHQFVAQGRYTLPIGLGRNPDNSANPVFDRYHVALYPTNFLLDSAGNIVWRGVGLGPELLKELPEILARQGIK